MDAMAVKEELLEPLSVLPQVEFAFSYGSGVFPQSNRTKMNERPMVDYILGVSSPVEWHSKNIERNPHHYSWLAKLGGNWVSTIADRVGVGVHFNPFVPWNGKTIKYGVIATESLRRDMATWNSLYISGRLQKPVCVLVDKAGLENLNEANINAALLSAMLLAPREFTEEELYRNICGLSYFGDVRMLFAEDIHKVNKIVKGSFERFQILYRNAMRGAASSGLLHLPASSEIGSQSKLIQDGGQSSVRTMLTALPSTILNRMSSQIGMSRGDRQYVAEAVSQSKEGHAKLLRHAISGVVRTSSVRQLVSGFFAAGGANAVQYVARKASKAFRSRFL